MSTGREAPRPRYGGGALADLLPALAAGLGVPGYADLLGLAGTPAARARRVCLLLVDGLGWAALAAHAGHAPFLAGLLPAGRVLTAGFPSTTVASLASLGTGRPPGEHGLVGYQVALPGGHRLVNHLRWDAELDPRVWQPLPTVFEEAAAAGVTVTRVGPAAFAGSGLTEAALRGGGYARADALGERVADTFAALDHRAGGRDDPPALVYVYWADLDATGHRRGVGSPAWRTELEHVDALAARLAAGLPSDGALWVTADHGMVDVAEADRVDVDAAEEAALREGVALLGGEPRARHVYVRPGAAPDVLAAWRERLAGRAWVASRDEAVGEGWFGPRVSDWVRPRIGDVVVAVYDGAVVACRREPRESALVAHHGSLTPEELLVPLLGYVPSEGSTG